MPDLNNMSDEELMKLANGQQPAGKSVNLDEMSDDQLIAMANGKAPQKSFTEKLGETTIGQMVKGVLNAVKLPGDVYTGQTPVRQMDPASGEMRTSPEVIQRSTDLGLIASPGAPGRLTAATPGVPGRNMPPEGFPPSPAPVAPPVNPVVQAGEQVGVPVPRMLGTDSKTAQGVTAVLKQSPTGGSIIEGAADDFLRNVGGAAGRVAEQAAGKPVGSRFEVGAMFRGAVEKAIERGSDEASGAYASLRKAIDPEKLVDVTRDVAPTLEGIRVARQKAGQSPELGKELAAIEDLITRPEGATFGGLQRARSDLKRTINYDARNGGFLQGDLKQAAAAMDKALQSAARQASRRNPDRAAKLLQAADKRFSQQVETNRVFGNMLKTNADEALVEKVVRMTSERGAGNVRQLQFLRKELGSEAFDDMAGLVIDRMGRNRAGEFTGETFRNAWQAMSNDGKQLLFRDPEVRKSLDAINTLAEASAAANKLRSPSGRSISTMVTGGALVTEPVTTIAAAIGARQFAKIMAKPVTAKAATDFAKAQKAYAMKPSPTTKRMMDMAMQRFSVAAASELGVPANDIGKALMGSVQSAANSDQQQPVRPSYR